MHCRRLQGVVYHQVYRYFRLFPQDGIWIRVFVSCLFVLQCETGLTRGTGVDVSVRNNYRYWVKNDCSDTCCRRILETFYMICCMHVW